MPPDYHRNTINLSQYYHNNNNNISNNNINNYNNNESTYRKSSNILNLPRTSYVTSDNNY